MTLGTMKADAEEQEAHNRADDAVRWTRWVGKGAGCSRLEARRGDRKAAPAIGLEVAGVAAHGGHREDWAARCVRSEAHDGAAGVFAAMFAREGGDDSVPPQLHQRATLISERQLLRVRLMGLEHLDLGVRCYRHRGVGLADVVPARGGGDRAGGGGSPGDVSGGRGAHRGVRAEEREGVDALGGEGEGGHGARARCVLALLLRVFSK